MLLNITTDQMLFLRRFLQLKNSFANHLNRCYYSSDKKQESYFSAIGGESDEPPPDLSQQQVNTILRTNEMTIKSSVKQIKQIECNQLASNHPIEDRLRISRFNFKALLAMNREKSCSDSSDSIALAVFDGHGGGSCVDVISRRLFHYIALSLIPNIKTFNSNELQTFVQDLFHCPNPYHNITSLYEDRAAQFLKKSLLESENKALQKFVEDIEPTDDISSAIEKAFLRCDSDLSQEIEHNLISSSSSNILLHYYLSLAVSGCCVSLLFIHQNIAYIASTGDCRAVLGLKDRSSKDLTGKTIDLLKEHNSDNISELKRVLSEHPKSEQNNIIRDNRLLGQLMPLRAFGDFSFKWSIEKMKKLGLTRAFGSHVIPHYYLTPPYLTCKPEIDELSLINGDTETDRFIILATDGLWDHFESSRKVIKCVNRHRKKLIKQEENDAKDGNHFDDSLTLGEINDVLKTRAKPAITSFDEITAEDDLIDDTNCATHLIRTALGGSPSLDAHLDQYQQQQQRHSRIVTYLTLPQSVVRNFRDDISLIVIDLN